VIANLYFDQAAAMEKWPIALQFASKKKKQTRLWRLICSRFRNRWAIPMRKAEFPN
jgi:hypothetical protein